MKIDEIKKKIVIQNIIVDEQKDNIILKTDMGNTLFLDYYDLVIVVKRLNDASTFFDFCFSIDYTFSSEFNLFYIMAVRKYFKEFQRQYKETDLSLAIKMTKYILRLYKKKLKINNKKEYILKRLKTNVFLTRKTKSNKSIFGTKPTCYKLLDAYMFKQQNKTSKLKIIKTLARKEKK